MLPGVLCEILKALHLCQPADAALLRESQIVINNVIIVSTLYTWHLSRDIGSQSCAHKSKYKICMEEVRPTHAASACQRQSCLRLLSLVRDCSTKMRLLWMLKWTLSAKHWCKAAHLHDLGLVGL